MANSYSITAAKSDTDYRFSDDAREMYEQTAHTLGIFRIVDTRLKAGSYQYKYCQVGHNGEGLCLLPGTEFWDDFGDMVAA